MKPVFLLTFFAFIISAHSLANPVTIEINKKNEIILNASNCDVLSIELNKLTAWKKSKRENINSIPSYLKSGKKCSVKISDFVPEFIQKYHGKNAKGPNCWNTTLVLNEILPGKRFSSGEEMTLWMSSPLCQKVNENNLMPGDIGAIRFTSKEGKVSEAHGFIHISDQLIFHKPGPGHLESYALTTKSKMMSEYPDNLKSIKQNIDYFRCMSLEEYLKTRQIKKSAKLTQVELSITKIECLEEEKIFSNTVSSEWLGQNIKILKDLSESEAQNSIAIKSDDAFLWHGLLVRIKSLENQLIIDKLSK